MGVWFILSRDSLIEMAGTSYGGLVSTELIWTNWWQLATNTTDKRCQVGLRDRSRHFLAAKGGLSSILIYPNHVFADDCSL